LEKYVKSLCLSFGFVLSAAFFFEVFLEGSSAIILMITELPLFSFALGLKYTEHLYQSGIVALMIGI